MNETFCVMPFFGAEYNSKGFVTNCCLMAGNRVNQVKEQMLQGQRPTACNTCWKLEDSGVKSDRQFKNEMYDHYSNLDIQTVFDNCTKGQYSEQIIKLYTTNLCNSACITCGPELSTHWKSIKSIPIKVNSVSDNVLEKIDFKNLKSLSFLGGEPLYDKNIYRILQMLIDNSNVDCDVSFVTNGSVKLSKSQLDIFSKFKNLGICVSIDGIGPVFEYMRFPTKWDTVVENLQQYKSVARHLSVSYTVSNVNVLYYQETVDWFNSQNLAFNHNLVQNPRYYNVNSLPKSAKSDQSIAHLFREHQDSDDILFNKALSDLKNQDQLKNINAKEFVPRFVDLD